MSTLSIVLQQLAAPVPGGIGRYAAELTCALAADPPDGWDMRGVVARRSGEPPRLLSQVERTVGSRVPIRGLAMDRRVLAEAWRHGVLTGGAIRGADVVYAPSLLAPLPRRRAGAPRSVVTIHDAVPWTHPGTLTPRGVAWHRDLAARAASSADVIAVPTVAVRDALREVLSVRGEFVVVPGAPSDELRLPTGDEAEAIARRLELPERYLLAVGTLEPRKGLRSLVEALAVPALADVPLVIAGPAGWGDVRVADVAAEAGVAPHRVRPLGVVTDEELAVLYDRAAVFVMPSLDEGFGLPVVEAMRFGCPVVHTDVPALVEVAAGASVVVERVAGAAHGGADPSALAGAIAAVLDDPSLAARLASDGRVRAADFSWAASAAILWDVFRG